MTKQKKKQQQARDELKMIAAGFMGVATWYKTNSWQWGVAAFFLAFILFLGITLYIQGKREQKLLRSGIAQIDVMKGIEFENFLGQLFKQKGYKIIVTPASGDYGADLILQDRDKKIVVQAKRYKSKVGIRAVQEVIPAIAYYKADEAWVVTNSYLTAQAINLARSNDVTIIDRDALIALLVTK